MDHARSIGLGWLDVIQPRQRTELLGRLLDKDAPTDADSLVYTLTCGQSVCEMLAACHDLQGRRIGNMAFIGKMLPPATTASADAHSPAKLSNPNFYGLGRYDPTIHAAAALVNDVSLPLMATTAYAQAAQNHIASGLASDYGSASRALAHAVQQSVQAVSHLRRLRAVLSQGQTYFEPTDLGDLLETAIKDTQPLRQHLGIHLDTMLHDGPCLANLQASQIYEVLKQLISLGFDRAKTSQSGKACITLRRLPDDQWQITIEATGLTDTPRTPDVNADETSLAIASARTILWAHDGKLILGPSTPSSNAPVFSILIPCLAED